MNEPLGLDPGTPAGPGGPPAVPPNGRPHGCLGIALRVALAAVVVFGGLLLLGFGLCLTLAR
ncbi:MAG: hypothetical protein U0599_00955 [Vicinamibacteria bacterium]